MSGLTVRAESWPTRGTWTISRGSVTAVDLVIVELEQDGLVGRGECRPYARYDESVESVTAQIEGLRDDLAQGLDRAALQARLPAGAARNALDCAFWDLEVKQSGKPVWQLLDLPAPAPLTTAYTLSLDSPEAMGAAARENANRPLLKLKLAGPDDLARVAAVRENAPDARLIVDANEGWTRATAEGLIPALAELGVELIEQPLPAGADAGLDGLARPVKLAADESCHDRASLPALAGRYDVVNIKLDKTGGLTEALALKIAAEAAGFGIMVGCMVATSLAMAPAMLVAQGALIVDLDGPLVLAEDRPDGIIFEGSLMQPASPALWG
ncbi:MAG: N-acetyl-D-Glu racemase DgcA [Pseudomonadota bacterium]